MFFKHIKPMPGSQRLLTATWRHPRAILTALPKTNSDLAAQQKQDWVSAHLGPFQVFTCFTDDKPTFCEPGDILIDDRAIVKDGWEAAGGLFILHHDVQSTLEQLKSLGIEQ